MTPQPQLDSLRELFGRILPIETHDTADYAELTFGEHKTQAMTMDPATWLAIGEALPELLDENARLRGALGECIRRLRNCSLAGGNAEFAVDALCEQFEAALHPKQERDDGAG